ncbi:protein FAM204A isoform X2 [Kryptolebias marmoratus]|uniref:protein FAM204A isoform X2 n=1 Tax=Kryptolebias marmoratus TaxID=37003 RepID=UPI0007F940C7|nr:protein FAM204A isoform X2 [Kryptolebias marmoratus]
MYSGLLPKGLTEAELSSDPEEENADGKKELTEDLSRSVSNSAPRGDADNDSCSLPGISAEMWLKFQDLRKKKSEIKGVKILEKRSRRHRRGRRCEEAAETRSQDDCEKHWNDLKQYFNVNDRFLPPACSRPPPQSGLEKSMEKAIAEGDVAKAEEMSDRLATREMAVRVSQAASCRDFVQQKEEEEAVRAAQKRKKQLSWGFEAKQRWETKSNMGFM